MAVHLFGTVFSSRKFPIVDLFIQFLQSEVRWRTHVICSQSFNTVFSVCCRGSKVADGPCAFLIVLVKCTGFLFPVQLYISPFFASGAQVFSFSRAALHFVFFRTRVALTWTMGWRASWRIPRCLWFVSSHENQWRTYMAWICISAKRKETATLEESVAFINQAFCQFPRTRRRERT